MRDKCKSNIFKNFTSKIGNLNVSNIQTISGLSQLWCNDGMVCSMSPPHAKGWLIGKDPDAGRDWGQEEKGTTEDEMAEWHHWLNGHEFE